MRRILKQLTLAVLSLGCVVWLSAAILLRLIMVRRKRRRTAVHCRLERLQV